MDKLETRLVADGSQQGRHLYEFVSSDTISLQVFMLFNIASYYRCQLQTVDIRGAFLNAEFTSADVTNLPANKCRRRTILAITRPDFPTLHHRERQSNITIR